MNTSSLAGSSGARSGACVQTLAFPLLAALVLGAACAWGELVVIPAKETAKSATVTAMVIHLRRMASRRMVWNLRRSQPDTV